MTVESFIGNLYEAFGETFKLPVAFWYSVNPVEEPKKMNGCYFKIFSDVHNGIIRTLDVDTISCGGGKFYTGFSPMPAHVPNFVSIKEKYKQTPQLMADFLADFNVLPSEKPYLNFARLDKISSLKDLEGIIFFATPDVLSGLTTWAFLDNNSDDAVSTIFGSGCSATISVAVRENMLKGRRTFIGGFDPSVRPYLKANELTYTIPQTRFQEMLETMKNSCLYDTHAWKKVKERMNSQET